MITLRSSKYSWLHRLGFTITSVLMVTIAVVFASLFFVVLLAVGLAMGGWLWWKLRRLARQAQAAAPATIDGEYTVESISPALEDQSASSADPPPRGHS